MCGFYVAFAFSVENSRTPLHIMIHYCQSTTRKALKLNSEKCVQNFNPKQICLMGRKLELHIKPKTSVDQNMKGCPLFYKSNI